MMARLLRIGRDALAALHRINRNRRVVDAVAQGIAIGFRCLPPVLWDRSRLAQNLKHRAECGCGRDNESRLRRILGDLPARDYLPWRLTDVLGFTDRRRTPLGQVWHAEHEAHHWPQTVRYLRKRYRITDDEGATDAV